VRRDDRRVLRMTVGFCERPKFFVERRGKEEGKEVGKQTKWMRSDDWTPFKQASASSMFVLIFERGILTSRYWYWALSHYEKLMYGDPWIRHVTSTDKTFPILGQGLNVINDQTLENLKDKVSKVTNLPPLTPVQSQTTISYS